MMRPGRPADPPPHPSPAPDAVRRGRSRFGWFALGHGSVYAISLLVLFVFVWAWPYVMASGWLPNALVGLVLLVASRHRVHLRWTGVGVLTATAALYGPFLAWFLGTGLSGNAVLPITGAATLLSLGAAGVTVARRGPR
ncbi:MAG: hypothetical protein M3257_05345 [Actinomycetota bacterium]|nr:hypothetical protein [Actinomycetota bacterium]